VLMVHGTWIPNETDDFVQRGGFYVWVETDVTRSASAKLGKAVHPRHLAQEELIAFLTLKLGIRELWPSSLVTRLFALPTAEGRPLPSFELLPYVEEDEAPLDYKLAAWEVACYELPHVIPALNDMQFIATHAAEDFQLGQDLVFWQAHAQALKGLIAKHEYIPSMTYRPLPPGKVYRGFVKPSPTFEIMSGWEMLSPKYEAIIARHAEAMPMACTAGANAADDLTLFSPEPLLRHCSECILADAVESTPFPAQTERMVAGSFLYRAIIPQGRAPHGAAPGTTLTQYSEWLSWRSKLIGAHSDAGFTLCFRLEEASRDEPDRWKLHFMVAARQDPSLKMSLDDYWALKVADREDAARPFGTDFEKQLLLALGTAARIYPKIWEGLATDHPVGCRLILDEAFEFLQESAWVLEDAGFTIIVPVWWTPEGRRKAKVRLKTSTRAKKGSATVRPGLLSLQSVISYDYQLSIAGEAVSEAEWQQLVEAKAPLVQFRGQWMELDRDKMEQMLDFWRTRQHDAPEMSLLDRRLATIWNGSMTRTSLACWSDCATRAPSSPSPIRPVCRARCAIISGAAWPGCSISRAWG
jgi:hypothetical protein